MRGRQVFWIPRNWNGIALRFHASKLTKLMGSGNLTIHMRGGPIFWKPGNWKCHSPKTSCLGNSQNAQIFHLQLRLMLVGKRNPVFLSSWLSCTNSIRRFKKIVQFRSYLNWTKDDPKTPKPKIKLKHPLKSKNMERGHSHSVWWVG